MSIEAEMKKIKSWTAGLNVPMIEATTTYNKASIVTLPYEDFNSLEIFKQLFTSLKCKAIVFDELIMSSEDLHLLDLFEKRFKSEYFTQFQSLKSKGESSLGYTLHFFSEGVVYKIEHYLEEAYFFMNLMKVARSMDDEDEGFGFKEIPEMDRKKLAKVLAEHPNYPKLKTRSQRQDLAVELFSAELDTLKVHKAYGSRMIVSYAEQIWETEIKPKREEELKKRAQDLLGRGFTKVKIAAQLGISKDTLNKFI